MTYENENSGWLKGHPLFIFQRRIAGVFSKQCDKVVGIVNAYHASYFMYSMICGEQQMFGNVNAALVQVLQGRNTIRGAEFSA